MTDKQTLAILKLLFLIEKYVLLTIFLHSKQINDERVWILSMCSRRTSGPILISLFVIFSISITSYEMLSTLLLTSIIQRNFLKTVFAEFLTLLLYNYKCIYFWGFEPRDHKIKFETEVFSRSWVEQAQERWKFWKKSFFSESSPQFFYISDI